MSGFGCDGGGSIIGTQGVLIYGGDWVAAQRGLCHWKKIFIISISWKEGPCHANHMGRIKFGSGGKQEQGEGLNHSLYWGFHRKGKAGLDKQSKVGQCEWFGWASGSRGDLSCDTWPWDDLGQRKYQLGVWERRWWMRTQSWISRPARKASSTQ